MDADRNTPQIAPWYSFERVFPVKAGEVIHAGAMVMIDLVGAFEAGTTADRVVVGRAEEYVDNTNGADGAKTVRVRRGIFRYKNSSGADAISRHHIGSPCYVVDAETVALRDGSSTRSVAGKVFDVDEEGVWVEFTA